MIDCLIPFITCPSVNIHFPRLSCIASFAAETSWAELDSGPQPGLRPTGAFTLRHFALRDFVFFWATCPTASVPVQQAQAARPEVRANCSLYGRVS